MEVSTLIKDITPELPIGLAGFAHREAYTDSVYAPIFLKLFLFSEGKQTKIIVIADLIWWDDNFVSETKDEICRKYNINVQDVIFHATHNHSGPQTSEKFSEQLGKYDQNYVRWLKNEVLRSFELLIKSPRIKVTLEEYTGKSEIGVYRRKIVDGSCLMLPNLTTEIDDTLTVLLLKDVNHKNVAGLIHFSCHPTCTDENAVSSEYVGVCCEKVSRELDGIPVAFLQGFSGDIRPCLINDGTFYRGRLSDMKALGLRVAEDVRRILTSQPAIVEEFQFCTEKLTLPLIFTRATNKHEDSTLMTEWRNLTKNVADEQMLNITYWRLSKEVGFIFCNAEMVQSYGQKIAGIDSTVLPVAYSDGMIGYVADELQLEEGGYESNQFIYYFNLKGKLNRKSAQKVISNLECLVRRNIK